MQYYIINKEKTDGRYNEVHTTSCSHLPAKYNQHLLGCYSNANEAVRAARLAGFNDADGCYYCCGEAHHG